MSTIARIRAILRFILNWQRVRQLGQLSLLNRLAFALLVLVPLFTYCINAMQSTTGRYNNALSATREKIGLPANYALESVDLEPESAVEPEQERRLWALLWESNVQILESRVDSVLVGVFPKPLDNPELPRTWALAFFAALSILIGDTLLQLFCPSEVRQQSIDAYVNEQKRSFATSPSCLALETNLTRLRREDSKTGELAEEESRWQEQHDRELQRLEAELKTLREKIEISPPATIGELREQHEFLNAQIRELRDSDSRNNTSVFRRRMSIVERGSRLIYEDLAGKRMLAVFCSMTAYLGAGCCIAKILQEQSVRVAQTAGWL